MISTVEIFKFFVSFGFFVVALTIHEFAHGWVANRLGDPTAKYSGRLTLNPIAHIDPFGTVILPFLLFISTAGQFVFGYAKPVPVNFYALKNPKRDMVLVGAAGPVSNFLLALFCSILIKYVPLSEIGLWIFVNIITLNIILGVFNLVPIPPLDGSRILLGLLPKNLAYAYSKIEPFGFIVLMILVYFRILDYFIYPVIHMIINFLARV